MKNKINCDFKTSQQIDSGMQSVNVVDNKIVTKDRLNVIDKTRSAIDSKFGGEIDVKTQVDSLTNQLRLQITAETDAKIENVENKVKYETEQRLNIFEYQQDIKIENKLNLFEQEINTNVENRLTIFQEDVDENIDNRINILGNELNTRIDIFEENADKKYVPQRLNAFGAMDISGQTIIPDKAYTYVDVKLPDNKYQSTRVDLADIIQTKVVTEDINPDLTMRSYDYIFTKLINEGE